MDYELSRRGWFDATIRFHDAMAHCSNYPLAYIYAAFMTLSGHLLGRQVYIRYATPVYPNQYTCLVGPSGTHHKSTAMHLSMESLGDLVDNPIRSVTTQQGLLQALLNNGGSALLWLDEMGSMLQKKRQDFAADLLSRIVELYSCPTTAGNYTRYDPIEVKNTFLTILAGSTVQWLQSHLTANDLMAGFGNRMTFILGDPRHEKDWPPPPDWNGFNYDPILDFEGRVVLDERARERWLLFHNKFVAFQAQATPFMQVMAERIPEKVLKAVLVMCAWSRDTVASAEMVEAAIDWGRYLHACIQRLNPSFEQVERQVLAAIEDGHDTGPALFDTLSHVYSGTRLKEALNNLKWLGLLRIENNHYALTRRK